MPNIFKRLKKLGHPPEVAIEKSKKETYESMINDYAAAMERSPSSPMRIEDVSALPHSKDAILNALVFAIGQEHSKQMQEILRVAATSLAYYQPGVGKEPLERLGLDISKMPWPSPDDEDALKMLAKKLTTASALTHDRFAEFDRLVQEDLRQISFKIKAAIR